jgi:hypothetical protein
MKDVPKDGALMPEETLTFSRHAVKLLSGLQFTISHHARLRLASVQ